MIQKLCAGMPGRKTKSKKGFTLAELLIVVAIVAILVAIAIPVFKGSLDKANEAVKAANLRSAKAQATVEYLIKAETETKTYEYSVDKNGNIKLNPVASGTEGATSNTEGIVVVDGTEFK